MSDVTVIDYDDYIEACNDPAVHEIWRKADEYAERLVARGHCRCHLVINCPKKEAT